MSIMNMILTELEAAFLRNYRYSLEIISSWLLYIVIFGILIFSVKGYVKNIPMEGGGIVVSYAIWMLVLSITGGFANRIQAWAEEGVLEQVLMMPTSPTLIFILNQIGNLIIQFFGFVGVILVLSSIANIQLFWNATVIMPFVMIIISAMGIGFMAGAVTLLTKKAYGIGLIVEFFLLALSMIPSSIYSKMGVIVQVLPYAPGMQIIREVFTRKISFYSLFGSMNFWIFFSNSCFYFAIGLYIFNLSVRFAKQKGLLSGY